MRRNLNEEGRPASVFHSLGSFGESGEDVEQLL